MMISFAADLGDRRPVGRRIATFRETPWQQHRQIYPFLRWADGGRRAPQAQSHCLWMASALSLDGQVDAAPDGRTWARCTSGPGELVERDRADVIVTTDLDPLIVTAVPGGDQEALVRRGGRARNPQAERGGRTGPPDRSRHVNCGNGEGGQLEWSRRPGPDGGSRLTALDHRGSTVTASRCCPAVPAPQPQPRKPARMTVPPS